MNRIQVALLIVGLQFVWGCSGGSTGSTEPVAQVSGASSQDTNIADKDPNLESVPEQTEPGDEDFPRGSVAFAALVKAAQTNSAEAWNEAEAKLQALGASAVPALSDRLADENPIARELAAMLLAQIGPDASPAADGLVKLLKDESTFARVNAAAALSTFEGYATRAIPVLTELLADEDDNVRLTAATSLRNVGSLAVDALDELIKTLEDTNREVRAAAATTLGEIGPQAAQSLPALRKLGSDSEETVTKAAIIAIRRIDKTERPQVGVTIPASATE